MVASFPAHLAFDTAFGAYLAAEPRLPAKPAPVVPTPVSNVLEALAGIEVVVLDAFGVLNAGPTALPGAVTAVARLRAAGKAVRIITNDASGDRHQIAAAHRRRGFDFTAADLISSQDPLAEALIDLPDIGPWGVMAPGSWPVERLGCAELLILGDDAPLYDRVAGFVLLDAGSWTPTRQRLLEASLARRARPILVGNPDICAPMGAYMSVEPGYVAHQLAARFEVAVRFFGKPFPEVFNILRRQFPDLAPEQFLMVGDTPHTDVLGGRAVGFRTLLVTEGGFLTGQDVPAMLDRCAIWPDFIAPALGYGL